MKTLSIFVAIVGTLTAAHSAADPSPADVPTPPVTGTGKSASLEDLKYKVTNLFFDNGVYDLDAIESRLQVSNICDNFFSES